MSWRFGKIATAHDTVHQYQPFLTLRYKHWDLGYDEQTLTGNSICDGHQWRVQSRCDAPDNVVSNQTSKTEGKLLINRGPVAFPSPIAVPIPVETVATSRVAFCHGVIACASFSASAAFVGVGDAVGAGGGARGTGSRSAIVYHGAPRTTSSSKLIRKLEGLLTGATERRKFVILFEYSVEDWVGRRDGRSV